MLTVPPPPSKKKLRYSRGKGTVNNFCELHCGLWAVARISVSSESELNRRRTIAMDRCDLLTLPGVSVLGTPGGFSCRLGPLSMGNASATACAAECERQPLCTASTWYPTTALCVGRTAGAPHLLHRPEARATGEQPPVTYWKRCARRACGGVSLQARLDAACSAWSSACSAASLPGECEPACRGATTARNARAFKDPEHEDFDWVCARPPTAEAPLRMACADDDGATFPCPTVERDLLPVSWVAGRTPSPICALPRGVLHDVHRAGCGSPPCLLAPGVGPPASAVWPTRESAREERATLGAAAAPPPTWRPRDNRDRIAALRASGYLNCSASFDETKVVGSCALHKFRSTPYGWLHHVWGAEGAPAGGRVSTGARAVSWWLPDDSDADVFDPISFLDQVMALHRARGGSESGDAGRRGSGGAGRRSGGTGVAQVLFLGDSTSRQQAVSLCCLLRAGCAAEAAAGLGDASRACSVAVTDVVPFGRFRCEVSAGGASVVARVTFDRVERQNTNHVWRPPEPDVQLPSHVLRWVREAPTVLVLNMGAWEFEDGCDDMHSLHDSICNGTRPWLLGGYALKWKLLLAAVESAYGARGRERGSLVALRMTPPRDFEGATALRGGKCVRSAPLDETELAAQERTTAPLHPPWRRRADGARPGVDVGSMRFAVLAQNALLLAAAVERRHPYIRVLDAYEVARRRADAHPSVAPRSVRSARAGALGINNDCQHYCLPGVPDVWNGRLHTLLAQAARRAAVAEERGDAVGEPLQSLRRWNFALPGERPFVQLVQAEGEESGGWDLALNLNLQVAAPSTGVAGGSAEEVGHARSRPTLLSCPLPATLSTHPRVAFGVCADI